MKTFLTILTVSLSAVTAFAGPGDGGGGKGILCKQPDGSQKVYLADTFQLERSGKLDDLAPTDPSAVVVAVAKIIESKKPQKIYAHPHFPAQKVSLGYMIAHRYSLLSFNRSASKWLKDLPDDNINPKSIPAGCEKVQLAVQDIPEMKVETASGLDEVSWLGRGFLELHEVFVSLRGKPGADTTPIRREVELIAIEMNKPNSPMRAQILELLKAKRVPYQDSTKLSHDLSKYCQSRLSDEKPLPGDSPEVTRCRRISAQIRSESRLHDLSTSLVTVLEAPKAMKCIVAGPRAPNKPSQVSMVLHEGAGLPGVWAGRNKFEVSVDGVKTISKRSWFNTQRMHRSSGNRSYGEASISAFFVTKDRKNITLAVGGYDDLTNTMNGSLTFADPTVLSYPNHKSFKISCYVGKLPMGLDLDNSEPSRQRPVEPDPDFSVPGCDSILLATKTRAQQDHEVATMRGLILSDISNGAAILKYMKAENEMHNSVMNGWKKNRPGVLELIAAMKSVEQNPAVKLYLETRVVSERPRKCVKFEGE